MLNTSEMFDRAIMSDRRELFAWVRVGDEVYRGNDIVSIDYDAGSMQGEGLGIGATYANGVKITFCKIIEGIEELTPVMPSIGVRLEDESIEYLPLGEFLVTDYNPDRNANETKIECADKMVMMGGKYESELTYPTEIYNVAVEIANKAGIPINTHNFGRLSGEKIEKPIGYTYRQAIGLIAQFEGGFATFNRDGLLEVRTLNDPNFKIKTANYYLKGLVKNEVTYKLGGITVKVRKKDAEGGETEQTLQAGHTAGSQVTLENNVMKQHLLDKIYGLVKDINFFPSTLQWQGNPALEAGDWVTTYDTKGNEYKFPCLTYTLSFKGGLSSTVSADTKTQSSAIYQYKGPLEQKIEWLESQVAANGKNQIYRGMTEPPNPKEGDLWYKPNGPDIELWIYREVDGELGWHLEVSTKPSEEITKLIDKSKEEMEEIKKTSDKSVEIANDAVGKSGLAEQLAQQSKDLANTAKNQSDINSIQLINVNKIVSEVQTSANNAKVDAQKALESAKKAETTAITIKNDVDNINGSLSTVISKTDKLDNTVTTQGTQIRQALTGLSAKADSTVVNTLKNTVTQHTSDLNVLADKVALSLTKNDIKDMATQSWTNTLVTGEAGKLTAKIAEVNNTKIDKTTYLSQVEMTSKEINTRIAETMASGNLLPNANFDGLDKWTPDAWELSKDRYSGSGVAELNISFTKFDQYATLTSDYISYTMGDPLQIGFKYRVDGKVPFNYFSKVEVILWGYDVNKKYVSSKLYDITTDIKDDWSNTNLEHTSFKNSKIEYIRLEIKAYGSMHIYVTQPALYKATISPKVWQRDSVSYSDYKQTADSMRALINSKVGEDYVRSQLQLKANELTVDINKKSDKDWVATQIKQTETTFGAVIKDSNDKITSLQANLNGMQSTVADKADKSTVTQLSNQLTSIVGNVSDSTPNMLPNALLKGLDRWAHTNQFVESFDKYEGSGIAEVKTDFKTADGYATLTSDFVPYRTSTPLKIGLKYKIGSGVDLNYFSKIEVILWGYDVNKKYVASSGLVYTLDTSAKDEWVNANLKFASYSDFGIKYVKYEIKISGSMYAYFTRPGLYNSKTEPVIWRAGQGDLDGLHTQVTQLKDTIDLRVVKKGEVVSAINLSPESAYIKSSKIYLDGDSYIARATINNAMIANLSADKVTFGTLNAANVNLINVNASNIVTGTLRGITIEGGEIIGVRRIYIPNAQYEDYNSGSIYVADGNGRHTVISAKYGLSTTSSVVAELSMTAKKWMATPYIQTSELGLRFAPNGLGYVAAIFYDVSAGRVVVKDRNGYHAI